MIALDRREDHEGHDRHVVGEEHVERMEHVKRMELVEHQEHEEHEEHENRVVLTGSGRFSRMVASLSQQETLAEVGARGASPRPPGTAAPVRTTRRTEGELTEEGRAAFSASAGPGPGDRAR